MKHANLKKLSNLPPPGMPVSHWEFLRGVERQARLATGATLVLDTRRQLLYFGYARPDGDFAPAMDAPLHRGGDRSRPFNTFDPVLDQYGLDTIIYALQVGQADPKRKARWALAQRNRAESDRKEGLAKYVRDFAEGVGLSRYRFNRSRMGMHSKYRRSLVVNGLADRGVN
jgi:hypothetical protein